MRVSTGICMLAALLAAHQFSLRAAASVQGLTEEQRRRPSVQDTFQSLEDTKKSCPPDGANLLMGAAFNMDAEKYLCGFLKSWKRFSPDTHIAVMLLPSDKEHFEAYTKIDYPNVHGVYISALPPNGSTYAVWRFYVQRNYMELCGYFDPAVEKSGSYGDPRQVRVIQVGWNLACQKLVSGQDTDRNPSYGLTFKDFELEFISCSAATLGSAHAMANYMANMCDVIQDSSSKAWRRKGTDQALHIYLMSVATYGNKPLPYPMKIMMLKNGESPVLGFSSSGGGMESRCFHATCRYTRWSWR
eukprot:gene14784-20834_t